MGGGSDEWGATESSVGRDGRVGAGVAVVLSGAGARGAYEVGALSVLLPALGRDQPRLYVGTSAGALNAVGFSAFSHLDPETAGERMVALWRKTREGDIFRPPLSTLVRSAGRLIVGAGRGRRRPGGLLDTAPLLRSLGRTVHWDQLHTNLRLGPLAGCGVVATARSDHRGTVFFESGPGQPIPGPDPVRGIRFVPATLTPAHLVASSAVPALFPAVRIDQPGSGEDWYVDGGVVLNTPIKPALMLGASQVLVVSTSPAPLAAPVHERAGRAPGVGGGMVDIMRAVLDDRAAEEVRALVQDNQQAALRPKGAGGEGAPRVVEYAFAGPERPGELRGLAKEILGSKGLWPPYGFLARMAARSHDLCQLASYVLYDPDFIDGAIELGQRDARAQLRPDGTVRWFTGSLPEASRRSRGA